MTKATTIYNRDYNIEQFATLKDVDGNRRLSIRKRLLREMEGQEVEIATYTGKATTPTGPNQTLTTLFTHYGKAEEYDYEQSVGDSSSTNSYVSVDFDQLQLDNNLSKSPYKSYILTRTTIEEVLEIVEHTLNNLEGKISDENLYHLFNKHYYEYDNSTHFLKRLEYELNWLLSYNMDQHVSLLGDWDINYRYYADLKWDFVPYEHHANDMTIEHVIRGLDAIERYDIKSPADALVVKKALIDELMEINPSYDLSRVELGPLNTKGPENYVVEEDVDVPNKEDAEKELKREVVVVDFALGYLETFPGVPLEHVALLLESEDELEEVIEEQEDDQDSNLDSNIKELENLFPEKEELEEEQKYDSKKSEDNEYNIDGQDE